MSKKVFCILHSPIDTAGNFQDFFIQRGYEFHYIIAPGAREKDFDSAEGADILLVMGGAMGVYEKEEFSFLKRELQILKTRINLDLPTIGICLGAQLIAEASGGKVYLSSKEEFGWFPVLATEKGLSDPVTGKEADLWKEPAFHWHQDGFDLPLHAEKLLFSEAGHIQAFRLKSKVYGFLFHLEVDAGELGDWIAGEPDLEYGLSPGTQSKDFILSQGFSLSTISKTRAYEVLSRFIKLA